MKNGKIVTALASYGMSGRVFHAPFLELHVGFELKLILERSKTLSRGRYPKATIVNDFQKILIDSEVELVIINTPTCLHFEMCKQALLAGKNVVVEKPFTSTVAQGEELIALAEKKDLLLTVYHNKRLEGDVLTVKELIDNKKFGDLKFVNLALHRYRPEIGVKRWKEEKNPGAGLLYDIGSHMIDFSLMMFGYPQKIRADLQIQREHGQVVDCFSIDLIYDRFQVNLFSDMLTKETKPSIVVEGSKGVFVKYGHDPQELNLSKEKIDWTHLGDDLLCNYGSFTSSDSGVSETIKTKTGTYMGFYQNLSKVFAGEASLLVSAEQALQVVKIIEEAESQNND
ncbi:MAG: scyllo-inositol 2-dehydrogenase (NADP+) [Saprospiraceae bacterium]|jgi:scyllo-inositol 2-dehydrogenase (NADP+)